MSNNPTINSGFKSCNVGEVEVNPAVKVTLSLSGGLGYRPGAPDTDTCLQTQDMQKQPHSFFQISLFFCVENRRQQLCSLLQRDEERESERVPLVRSLSCSPQKHLKRKECESVFQHLRSLVSETDALKTERCRRSAGFDQDLLKMSRFSQSEFEITEGPSGTWAQGEPWMCFIRVSRLVFARVLCAEGYLDICVQQITH